MDTRPLPESTVAADFDERSWDMVGSLALSKQLVSGDVLIELARNRGDIVVLTADLGRPTRVINFGREFPDRYFNFGIAERTMIGAAAGMATAGLLPYVSGYACFLALLAADQIRLDVAYTKLPVRFLSTHSGLAMGYYGASHHATEDIGMLRSIANLTVLAPIDAVTLRQAIETTVDHPGPLYFRLGRGRETPVYASPIPNYRIGGSNQLHAGSDATIFATGILVDFALQAAQLLEADRIELRVIDAYSLKPIDADAVRAACEQTGRVFTAEEHNVIGGLGSAVAEVMAELGTTKRLTRIGMQDAFSILGPPTHLYRHYGFDPEGIANTVRTALQ
ncbi:MAG: transketolase family protein [Candidatus Velthaea sp.]